ncbi:hypothetical protein SynSYN20_01652 [Synechococcus sp. SYN20]|uniref:hypothetical protein n=1 Tax=Synechococcus sp. SYN20 TaxID=1050714 RepID=UPI0016444B6D|nr:hypothetical protein [Synechococcus sp. SYN20]QNJ25979.1 hypothetical protein SynSYN20_01652 [Synechococcus sp. SYN20]
MKISGFQAVPDGSDESLLMISYTEDGGATFKTRKIRLEDFIDDFRVEDLANVGEDVEAFDGAVLSWSQADQYWHAVNPAIAAAPVAAGFTLGLTQKLLAENRQIGKTVFAVPYVYSDRDALAVARPEGGVERGRCQVVSLEDGNTLFVYASGNDFLTQTIQEGPIFLSKGEIYVIDEVVPGAIITMEEGGYGICEQGSGASVSPMPLLSLALGFNDSFFFAFRNSEGQTPGGTDQGWIHVVNGPIASTVNLQFGNGLPVADYDGNFQIGIELAPWEYRRLYTRGNTEYRLTSSQLCMAALNASMGPSPRFYDSRLIMPMTTDGITWPRSGFVSAQFPSTLVRYWNNAGFKGANNDGSFVVSPGAPIDSDSQDGTAAAQSDYEAEGATRYKAAGVISAYSGADSAGLEATPLLATKNMTQRVAIPCFVAASGDGGNNGIAVASPFAGSFRLYEWNPATGQAEVVTVANSNNAFIQDIPLARRTGSTPAANAEEQNVPASAMVSRIREGDNCIWTGTQASAGFNGGYVEATVPITVVVNSEQNSANSSTPDRFYRGTGGQQLPGIPINDDETLMVGITPFDIKAEIRRGDDGRFFRRKINQWNTTWEIV